MEAILAAVEPYTIHGTPYVRIVYATRQAPDQMIEGRVAAEGIYRGAAPGDRVEIRMLLGVIDAVEKTTANPRANPEVRSKGASMSEEMSIFEVMYNCRAMRKLKPDPVPEELLVKLIEAANQAPSGSNAQNGRWIVVRDQHQKDRLAALNKKSVERYLQRQRPAAMPHHDHEKRQRMLDAVEWQAEHMHEMPALVIACLELGGPAPESFFAGAGAGGSVWPGVQNLLLAARALGLGAAPTTLGLIDRAAVKEALDLPETMEAFCLIPVGYPMGKFGPVTRQPVETIMRWDRWS